jgi:hypothetical protein
VARRVRLVFVYLAGVMAFFECSARAFLYPDVLFERVLGDDESSYRLNWIRRGSEPGLSYVFDVYHPVRGWALAPNLKDLRVFGDRTLNSTSKGTRGRDEHDYARTPGRARILIFGDSFTFGEEVSDEDTYVAALEQMLPGTEVINCGVHGYGHDQMLLYLEEEGLRYRPDVVILGFVAYDMERNLLKFRDFAKPRFELRAGTLVLENTPVPPPEAVRSAEAFRSKFLDLCSMLRERSSRLAGEKREASVRLTRALLDAFRKAGSSAGARVVFAYLPVWHELDWPGEETTEGESFLGSYCRDRGAECVDLRPRLLEGARRGEHLRASGHWNKREHLAAAGGLRDYLLGSGAVKATKRTE